MKFCPQCGTPLTGEDLFCQQCGYRIDQEVDVSSKNQGQVMHQNMPQSNPNDQPYGQPIQPPENQYQNSGPGYSTPVQSNGSQTYATKKRKLIPILVVTISLIIIGAGCWLAYVKFFKEKATTPLSDTTNLVSTPSATAVPDSTANVNNIQPDQVSGSAIGNSAVKKTAPQKEKVVTTTPSKTKTIAKTEQLTLPVNETQTPTVNPTETQPPIDIENEPPSKTIFKIGQLGIAILKNPEKDCDFKLKDRYCITRITTDHYNSGRGTSFVGSIGIEDMNSGKVKKWHAKGLYSKNGLANSKWVIEPRIILEAGTYVITDSDRESWTKNFSGKGFVTIEGYKVQ
ncbi:MAG: hypothetical protein HXX14_18565 [Bacteroidetes bacterium]|nr:hypothetical protein [Bacteroidota bacterium]